MIRWLAFLLLALTSRRILVWVANLDTENSSEVFRSNRNVPILTILTLLITLFTSAKYNALGNPWVEGGCLTVATVSLLAACTMDYRTHMVYNYLWVPPLAAGLFLWWSRSWGQHYDPADDILALFLCTLIQEIFFPRKYGRADSHAFLVCALLFAGRADILETHLLHMTLTFLLLTIHQSLRHNITPCARLKTPVPLIPYITISLAAVLLFAHITLC